MRLAQGKIGKQESASLAGLAIVMSVVFTLEGNVAYADGNATYIALPLSVALSLGLFLLMQAAMRKLRAASMFELCEKLFGAAGKIVAAPLTAALYLFAAWSMLERFTTVLHGVVYVKSQYSPVIVWVLAAVTFIALKGFECLGRMAKIFAVAVTLAILIRLGAAIEALEPYRLFPFPSGGLAGIGLLSLRSAAFAFPPLLGLLCAAPAMQGEKNVRLAGVRGAAAAFVMVALVQLAIGMAFPYDDLRELELPLLRVHLILIRETELLRLDLIGVFVLLIGAIVSAAYFVYSAAAILTRTLIKFDIRPAVTSQCAALAGLLLLEHILDDWTARNAVQAIKSYAWLALAPFPPLAAAAFIKAKIEEKKQKGREGASDGGA